MPISVRTSAIGRVMEPMLLLSVANDHVADPVIRDAALDRLESLGQWILIATNIAKLDEQKKALAHISGDKKLRSIVRKSNSSLIQILAAERIQSMEIRSEVEAIVQEAEKKWASTLSSSIADIRGKFNQAKSNRRTEKDRDASFAREVGTDVMSAMGDLMGGLSWCSKWKKRFESTLSEIKEVKRCLLALDIPRGESFSSIRVIVDELKNEMEALENEQRQLLRSVEEMDENYHKMMKLYGPSLLL